MEIGIEQNEKAIRVVSRGDIDHEGAEALKKAVDGLSFNGRTELVFDFRGVTYVGSAGLGKLLLFYKRLSAQRVSMRIEAAPPSIQNLLKELRMDTLFSVS
jgi:anti-anti-sigma factor